MDPYGLSFSFCYSTCPLQLLNTWANFNETLHIGEALCILCSHLSQKADREERKCLTLLLGEHFQCNLRQHLSPERSVSAPVVKKIQSSRPIRDMKEPGSRIQSSRAWGWTQMCCVSCCAAWSPLWGVPFPGNHSHGVTRFIASGG